MALQNCVKNRRKKAGKPYEKIGSGCSEDCMNCSDKGCTRRFYDGQAAKQEALDEEELTVGSSMRARAKAEELEVVDLDKGGI